MPRSINNAYLLDSANGAGDKKSRPFWWPGGDGELKAKGTISGTVILHQGAPQLTQSQRALSSNYDSHGSTLTDATANKSDRFWAGEGWFFVELQNTAGGDDCTVWVSRVPNGENTEPHYDDGNENPVT